MDIEQVHLEFEAGRLKEAIVEPSASGWLVRFKTEADEVVTLTEHGGGDRLFHSLEAATRLAQDIGFKSVHVEEHF
jgi:hypothetical protein